MLQLQPEMEIVLEFIRNDEFKYLRALGAIYLRLVGKAEDIYRNLEPLYNDYRKLAYRTVHGWSIKHMDEFIDDLLNQELVCDIALPFLAKRHKLEDLGTIEPRKSVLDYELEEYEGSSNNKRDENSSQLESSVKVKTTVEKNQVHIMTAPVSSQLNSNEMHTNDYMPTKQRDDDSRGESRDRDRRGRDIHDERSHERSRRDDSRDRGRRDDSRDRGRRDDSRDRSSHARDSRDDKKFDNVVGDRSRSRSPHVSSMPNDKDERIKKKKEAKFDKMFKSKKSTVTSASSNEAAVAPEGSIEYWNQIRKGLGMKELK